LTEHLLHINSEITQVLSSVQAHHYRAIPLEVKPDFIKIAVDATFFNESHRAELELIKSRSIVSEEFVSNEIDELLFRYYRSGADSSNGKQVISVNVDNGESFFDDLVKEAKDIGSSDIHIEAYEKKCRVRLRIDGKLIEKYRIDQHAYPSLINKLKIRANLDIAEKRLPQDGRIHYTQHNDEFDIRVSVLPSMYGEKVVLRILSQDASRLDLEKLGLSEEQLSLMHEAIRKPDGIILISGPTGSGKTTTLYSTLKILNRPEVNISTVEDPIEYTLEGVNQVQVKDGIGLTFAAALRSFLRQDPDIIMLGEIRDSETAEMAIRASLTGHLVLSTIHTNSAIDTILRLIDMGVPAFLIATTIKLSVAQRLVRKLCTQCKESQPVDESSLPPFSRQNGIPATHFVHKGCSNCHYTGYDGRIALYEMIEINNALRQKIKSGENLIDSLPKNHQSLSGQAWKLYASGQTSLEEVYSLISSEQ